MDYFSSCFSITTYGYYCSYVSRRLLILSVFRTLSALSTFPDRTSSFRMQIVFVSSDVKSKQLSEKITSSSISNHTLCQSKITATELKHCSASPVRKCEQCFFSLPFGTSAAIPDYMLPKAPDYAIHPSLRRQQQFGRRAAKLLCRRLHR